MPSIAAMLWQLALTAGVLALGLLAAALVLGSLSRLAGK